MSASALSRIKSMQVSWAEKNHIATDSKGYTSKLASNLLFPINEKTLKNFREGDGNELGNKGKPSKMCALHSSSALAVNVFDYWRNKDASPLALALGIPAPIAVEAFEKKYPTGLRGNAPNLDVVIQTPAGKVAIESKFTEPYSKSKQTSTKFKDKYFANNQKLWLDVGLPKCQKLASDICDGRINFTMLDAQQLLKHILGLQNSKDKPRLLYLWYSIPGDESDAHLWEIEVLTKRVDDHIDFRSMTYQDLYSIISYAAPSEHQDYLHKLGERYFSDLTEWRI